MDFVSDKFADGRWFRILTIIDQFTRECVGLEADRAMNVARGQTKRSEHTVIKCRKKIHYVSDIGKAMAKAQQYISDLAART